MYTHMHIYLYNSGLMRGDGRCNHYYFWNEWSVNRVFDCPCSDRRISNNSSRLLARQPTSHTGIMQSADHDYVKTLPGRCCMYVKDYLSWALSPFLQPMTELWRFWVGLPWLSGSDGMINTSCVALVPTTITSLDIAFNGWLGKLAGHKCTHVKQ